MKSPIFILAAALAFGACAHSKKEQPESAVVQTIQRARNFRTDIPLDSIRLSDPCILADKATATYYMAGTGGR